MKKTIKLLIVVLLIIGSNTLKVDASENLNRIYGENRIETSVELSKKIYSSSNTVILTGYRGEVDSLSGTILAHHKSAPILITRKDEVSSSVLNRLKDLKTQNIYILGGENVISQKVVKELQGQNFNVRRIDGQNRSATAVNIAKEVFKETKSIDEIFLALGYGNYADALSIGPVSASKKIPIFLTKKDKIPSATKEAIKEYKIKKVTIIGGETAIGKEVISELKSIGVTTIDRIDGDNRMDTAIKIGNTYTLNPKDIILANGYTYADAALGGYFAAKNNAPILLTKDYKIDNNTLNYIKVKRVTTHIIGGEKVIDKNIYKEVLYALKEPIRLDSFNISGMKIKGSNNVITAEVNNSEKLLYRFYYKNENSKEWNLLRDFSEKNNVNWIPKEKGNYLYKVDIKYEGSPREADFTNESKVEIGSSIPVFYDITRYQDSLEEALAKQVAKGKNSKEEIKKFLDPNNFLQFDPLDESINQIEGIVLINNLNVRKGPGTSYAAVGKTNIGDIHKIYREIGDWYEISYKGGKAYISRQSDYVKKRIRLISVMVNTGSLNVREEPKTSSPKKASVSKGDVFVVLGERNGWYKINEGTNNKKNIGWISGQYADYVKDVPKDMYQFMILKGQPVATITQMDTELKGKGILSGRGKEFIKASKDNNINELYLMAHALHETNHGKSTLAQGVLVEEISEPNPDYGKEGEEKTIKVPVTPQTVYNMYGIGAFNSAPVELGSEKAYKEGWFSVEKAIIGGAKWISDNYINSPRYNQNTLYKMRYNIPGPVWHQYATDVGWAYKQIKVIDEAMKFVRKIDKTTLEFDIPHYK